MTDFEKYGILANDMYHVHNLAADSLNEWKIISSVHKNGNGTKIRHLQKIRYSLAELMGVIEQDRILATEAFAVELRQLIDTVRLILNDNYSKVEWQEDYISLKKNNGAATVSFPSLGNHPIPIYGALFRTVDGNSYLCFQSDGFEIMMAIGVYESSFTFGDDYSIIVEPRIPANEAHAVISGLNSEDPTEYSYEQDQNGGFSTNIGETAYLRKEFDGNVTLITVSDPCKYRVSAAQFVESDECTGLVLTMEDNTDLMIFIPTIEVME